jgi:hypothetical protein
VLRHGWRLCQIVHNPTKQEQRDLAERDERLSALASGQPVRGARNGAAYAVTLFPDDLKDALGSVTLPHRTAYLDAEDPNRSTWCRFVNHAQGELANAVLRIDALERLVWLEALRDIEVGEEVTFDYGEVYKWDEPPAT